MQRKQEADLLPLDTEIERTLKNLKKKQPVQKIEAWLINEKDYSLFLRKKKLRHL